MNALADAGWRAWSIVLTKDDLAAAVRIKPAQRARQRRHLVGSVHKVMVGGGGFTPEIVMRGC